MPKSSLKGRFSETLTTDDVTDAVWMLQGRPAASFIATIGESTLEYHAYKIGQQRQLCTGNTASTRVGCCLPVVHHGKACQQSLTELCAREAPQSKEQ